MDNQDNQNITNDNSYPVDRNRDLVAEKLIMNELLNSEDFETLLQTTIDEFRRTFAILNKNTATIEVEKEIE